MSCMYPLGIPFVHFYLSKSHQYIITINGNFRVTRLSGDITLEVLTAMRNDEGQYRIFGPDSFGYMFGSASFSFMDSAVIVDKPPPT